MAIYTSDELRLCKNCGHPRTIHEHYRPSGLMFARNTPEGREAVLKQFKKDTVASWCATKGCSCKKYKVSLRDRITQIMDKLLR